MLFFLLFFFFLQARNSLSPSLFHYKGEGFTCDLSAREPLVSSRRENLERIFVLPICVGGKQPSFQHVHVSQFKSFTQIPGLLSASRCCRLTWGWNTDIQKKKATIRRSPTLTRLADMWRVESGLGHGRRETREGKNQTRISSQTLGVHFPWRVR